MRDRTLLTIAGGLLAIIFLLALSAVRESWTEGETVRVETEQQAAKRINKQEAKGSIRPEIGQQSPTPDQQGREKQSEAGEETSEFWPPLFGFKFKVTDSLLVLFTAILAWKTAGLDKATRKLWEAGERQIRHIENSAKAAQEAARVSREALVADNRAWIKITGAKIGNGIQYDEYGDLTMSISVSFQNVGNSPALNVSCYAWLGILKSHSAILVKQIKELKYVQPENGFTMFPGEKYPQMFDMDRWDISLRASRFDINQALEETSFHGVIFLRVFGYVNYVLNSDPGVVHQNIFSYFIYRNGFGIKPDILPMDGNIHPDDLMLVRSNIAAMEYAD